MGKVGSRFWLNRFDVTRAKVISGRELLLIGVFYAMLVRNWLDVVRLLQELDVVVHLFVGQRKFQRVSEVPFQLFRIVFQR